MTHAALVSRIMQWLNKAPRCKALKTHGGPYGEAGTPDIFGVYKGMPFFIEVKVGSDNPTKVQYYRIRQWEHAGAFCAVAREDFDPNHFLEAIGEIAEARDEGLRSQRSAQSE